MDAKGVALKLFLDELGISDSIQTVDDRKRVQKAVYLGQRARVSLGYRFGWYLLGPYSTSLAEDYYALAEAMHDGECDYENRELISLARERLETLKPLLEVPKSLRGILEQEDWLELAASTDYLLKVRRLNEPYVQTVLEREKPKLAPHCQEAISSLRIVGLI